MSEQIISDWKISGNGTEAVMLFLSADFMVSCYVDHFEVQLGFST